MELALIPPRAYMHHLQLRRLHMMLPDLLKDPMYERYFRYLAQQNSSYIIMDNGMFESGVTQTPVELIALAQEYQVNEIVMPDTKGDLEQTLNMIEHFLVTFQQMMKTHPRVFNLMAVVQGRNMKEWRRCVAGFNHLMEHYHRTFVIGLPRWISEERGYGNARLDLVDRDLGRNVYHLLGCSRRNPQEVRSAYTRPNIRSIDTDAPYVWAYRGLAMDNLEFPNYPERPLGYYNLEAISFPLELVGRNIRVLEAWTVGTQASTSGV